MILNKLMDDEFLMEISILRSREPKKCGLDKSLYLCMLLWSLCGPKASAKSNGPILLTFSQTLYF